MNRENLFKKHEKQDKNDSLTLVLTYHPALNKIHEILKKAHRHTFRSPRLSVYYHHPLDRVALRNPKTMKDHLVRSKLKICNCNNEKNVVI